MTRFRKLTYSVLFCNQQPAISLNYTQQCKRFLLVYMTLFLASCSTIDGLFKLGPAPINTTGIETGVIKFVAVGDTGMGNDGQYQVANAIHSKCEQDGCDFVLMLGNNIYSHGVNSLLDPQFKTKFEIPYQNIKLPFFMVLGDHDYGGTDLGIGYEYTKSEFQVKYTERSSKWIMPQHYYTFVKENITFVALDTTAQLYGHDDQQRRDVAQWLADATSTWKIAFGHHPYLSNGLHGNAGEYNLMSDLPIASGDMVKRFAEDIWCGKVDLYIAAHDHNRQWLNADCAGTKLIISGAGSDTEVLQGNNPALFQKTTLGFLYVRIEGNTLTGQFIDTNGKVEFSHVIEKQSGSEADVTIEPPNADESQ